MLTRRAMGGFGMIEMLVVITIMALMTAAAMPSLSAWVRSARMRAVADALQAGLHVAQTEAQRRSSTAVIFTTNNSACNTTATATAGGAYWQVRSVPGMLAEVSAEAVQCGVLPDVGAGIAITASATALCFGADGRQIATTNPASIGVDCAAAAATYLVQRRSGTGSSSDRRLQLNVSMAGAIRMCDPDKASTAPEGCR